MLMNIFGCFDYLSEGIYMVGGCDMYMFDSDEFVQLCCEYFGFVFQCYYLLLYVDVVVNFEMLVIYVGILYVEWYVCVCVLFVCFGFVDCVYYCFG